MSGLTHVLRLALACAVATGSLVAVSRTADSPATAAAPHFPAGRTFSDDFTGRAGSAPNSTLWRHETGGGGWGNNELESYTDRTENASLDGRGHLAIRAYQEKWTGHDGITRQYTSARLNSTVSVRYGTISARIRLPSGQGLWPAFWTLGSDIKTVGWPRCGEIDVMEALNTMPTAIGTVHGPDGRESWTAFGRGGQVSPAGGLAGAWHVFSVAWAPTSVTWQLDGVPFRTVRRSDLASNETWELDKPHHLLLNMAVGGWPGDPTAATFARGPQTMYVDWVRVQPRART